jgi:hypothetical protein
LLEKDKDDDYRGSRVTPSSSTTIITPEWLSQNCYIDTYSTVDGYYNNYNNYYNNKGNEEDSLLHYCEVCIDLKLDYRKYYCHTDKGKNRQIITICTECLRSYQEKRYRLFGKPTGVIAVSDKSKVEGLIMCA